MHFIWLSLSQLPAESLFILRYIFLICAVLKLLGLNKYFTLLQIIQILLVILDCLLVVSIARISRERRKMMSNEAKGASRKELNAALVILLMAALPLSIYIPNAVVWTPYILSSVIPNMSSQLTLLCVQLGYLTLDLSIIVHVWNIFVYSARVSGFRSELFRLLSCGMYKSLITDSQSSAYSHDKI